MPETEKAGTRLIFQDATTLENASCGFADGFLWLWLPVFTMQEAISILFDAGKTGRIVFEYGAMSDEYTGFTNCVNVSINAESTVSACLTKGE